MRKLIIYSVTLLVFCFSTIRAQETEKKSTFKLPVISVAQGVLNFNGDIGYNKLNQPLYSQSGLEISIQNHTEGRLSFGLYFLSGRMTGEENTVDKHSNFQASIFSQSLRARYEFINNKRSDQVLFPYVTAGIEYVSFRSKTDLFDNNGDFYYYWSDGSVRNTAESGNNSNTPKSRRDYAYETSLRDANIDGYGKYDESAFSIPVGVGVKFKISNKCALDFSSVYHPTNTDYIDGITPDGIEGRQGNDKNDNFFYTSVAFRLDLGAPSERKNSRYTYVPDVRGVNFDELAAADADGDGISDVLDDSSATPASNQVDVKGKPLDKDDDGIPDYRDKELNSATYAVVNEDGITITEEMVEEAFRKDSLAALPAVIEYLRAYDKLAERKPDVEQKWTSDHTSANPEQRTSIPGIYARLDIDSNGYITPKEISAAIDEYMSQKSPYSVQQFFDLIDFFFVQK
ncbi:MAG: hypothetical protein IPH33_05010 [Bacteroidetes bacterium]|nr:hypothetical protein [Bacteroidota bacterium]